MSAGILASFRGGEANGVALEFGRAPVFLRVVRGMDGKWDVLDQLEDDPALGEEVFIYRLARGQVGHVCTRGRGCFHHVVYEATDLIDPAGMEDRDAWRTAVTRVAEELRQVEEVAEVPT